MPNWTPITVDDLNDAKIAALVTALRTRALGSGQTDPSARVIQSVVDDVRRKIASCKSNQVDSDETTVPRSLLPMVVDLVLARLKGRLEITLEADEVRQIERHERNLDRIAACTDTVEQPDDAIVPEVQATSGTPSISCIRERERRCRREGL